MARFDPKFNLSVQHVFIIVILAGTVTGPDPEPGLVPDGIFWFSMNISC